MLRSANGAGLVPGPHHNASSIAYSDAPYQAEPQTVTGTSDGEGIGVERQGTRRGPNPAPASLRLLLRIRGGGFDPGSRLVEVPFLPPRELDLRRLHRRRRVPRRARDRRLAGRAPCR